MDKEKEIQDAQEPVDTPVTEDSSAQATEEAAIQTDAVEEAVEAEANNSEVSEAEATEGEALEGEILTEEKPKKKKKSIAKKWWFWVIIGNAILSLLISCIIGIAAISSISGSRNSGGAGSSLTAQERQYINMVKNATHSTYGVTYGAAFDSYFKNEDWDCFVSSDGLIVVEFTGKAYYDGDNSAKYYFQFVFSADMKQFSVQYVSINDQGQSALMKAAIIKQVFESYKK